MLTNKYTKKFQSGGAGHLYRLDGLVPVHLLLPGQQ